MTSDNNGTKDLVSLSELKDITEEADAQVSERQVLRSHVKRHHYR